MPNIIEALKEANKWWINSFKLDYKERDVYQEIKKFIDTKQILAFTGLRRVGKTTLILKIIDDRLNSGFMPQNIIYFSFDDFRDVRIMEVVSSYATLMNKNMDNESYLFLFDEIQKIENWEEQLKRIYDNHLNFKIVISGSESLFIKKKSTETLAGRLFEFKINQLSFREYLRFKGIKTDNLMLYKDDIIRAFHQYILCNGFPEIIDSDKIVIEKYIKENIIERIIYRDIPQIFPIRDVAILENIFNIILYDPGEIININDLANELKIARQTVSIYLDYLEKSFLIRKLYNFSRNIRKTEKRLKRYYPTIISPKLIEQANFGKVFETTIVQQLDAGYFWHDAYKNEVDIILTEKGITPIELKSGEHFEIKGILSFMKKFKVDNGIIITMNKESTIKQNDKTIAIIPAYIFLLKNLTP